MKGENPVSNCAPQLSLPIALLASGLLAVVEPFSRRLQVGSKGVTLPVACSRPSK